jgi:hypothetical protein
MNPPVVGENGILSRLQEFAMPDTPASSTPESSASPRNIWMRGLMMVLMALAFQLTGTLLGLLAVVQFVLTLVSEKPNERLCSFGQRLGYYLRQIAEFVSFATEEVPFPFADWPESP